MDKEKVVYTHNGILYSLKEGDPVIVTKWMNLEDMILSEISQLLKNKYCMIPFL